MTTLLTRSRIDAVVQDSMNKMTDGLDDLMREHGITRAEIRERLEVAWGTAEAWDDWCEENPDD